VLLMIRAPELLLHALTDATDMQAPPWAQLLASAVALMLAARFLLALPRLVERSARDSAVAAVVWSWNATRGQAFVALLLVFVPLLVISLLALAIAAGLKVHPLSGLRVARGLAHPMALVVQACAFISILRDPAANEARADAPP
jgi:hypothetical protein